MRRPLALLLVFLALASGAQAQQAILPLDVSTVTTGGTAVAAIASGHRSAGGVIQNPWTATVDLCINEIGTASGTTSAGSTTCIKPGASYKLAPSSNAVSVISSDSLHPFSGEALITPPPTTTTIYIVGNGSGTITPRSTATWTVQAWGAGQSGNDGTGAGGRGGGWVQGTFSASSGTPISFSLGAPGMGAHGTVGNGGDSWFSSSGSLIAAGGGSVTTQIGTLSATGGAGGIYTTQALPGGGGAGGSVGNGNAGGSPTVAVCVNSGGGAGGGGNGGGAVGNPCVTNSTTGGAGGRGFVGTGGAGGTSGAGAAGGLGAGGGGGGGNGTSFAFSGGAGGDDYDYGGGGGGGSGSGVVGGTTTGSNGGTPGGGGTDCFTGPGGSCTIGHGGWSVIKITYQSSDADQIYELGTIPMPVDIPPSWTNGYTTTTPGGGVTVLTKNAITATQLGYLLLLGVGK